MGGAPAPVTEDRTFAEIIADVPAVPSEAHYALLDRIEAWLETPDDEPGEGWDGFYLACSQALSEMNHAGASINSLLAEFKGTRHARSLHTKGLADLNLAKGNIADCKPLLERGIRTMKARQKHTPAARQDTRPYWAAPDAAVLAMRRVDLAMELWRDDDTRGPGVLDAINDIVDAYYSEHGPDSGP